MDNYSIMPRQVSVYAGKAFMELDRSPINPHTATYSVYTPNFGMNMIDQYAQNRLVNGGNLLQRDNINNYLNSMDKLDVKPEQLKQPEKTKIIRLPELHKIVESCCKN